MSRSAETDQIFQQLLIGREILEPVDRKALLARDRKGLVAVLDVRPAEEYRPSHITGAIWVLLQELKDRLVELPRYQEIVTYYRSPYCIFATEPVELLQKHSFRAVRLEDEVVD